MSDAGVLSAVSPQLVSSPGGGGRSGRIVAIASGKGGVGKTWLAITLAQAWARAGRRVLLCDADFGLANIDVQLGLNPPPNGVAGGLAALLGGQLTLDRAVARHSCGFAVLARCSGSGTLAALAPVSLEGLLETLRVAAHGYDQVVLDLGAGLDFGLRRMAVFADLLLVLATDEPTSLTDAYAVLKLYAADRRAIGAQGSARLVVNQAASLAGGLRTYRTLARACDAFLGAAPGLAGVIRRDPQVPAAIRRQTPLLDHAPASPAATDVAALAAAL